MDQQKLSARQFGATASNYLTSAVHAKGTDLERLSALAGHERASRVLDLGCGAGHVSFALARGGAQRITAYDPSSEMLAVVGEEALARGYKNIETRIGVAEVLPFDCDTFDLVVTRYSAHHWARVPLALKECARVTKAGGRLIVIDVIAPETPLLDTFLQVVEFLRDASHVRDYRLSEWIAMQKAAGFAEPSITQWKLPIEFKSWIERIGTPPTRIAALHAVFAELANEAREYFRLDAECNFVTDSAWIEAQKGS